MLSKAALAVQMGSFFNFLKIEVIENETFSTNGFQKQVYFYFHLPPLQQKWRGLVASKSAFSLKA